MGCQPTRFIGENNMTVQSVTIDVEVPEGYEAVKVAIAKVGDLVVCGGAVRPNKNDCCISPELILKPIKWKPRDDEPYYYVTSEGELQLIRVFNSSWHLDKERAKIGNCFQTRDEAQEVVDKFKALLAQ